MKGLRFRKSKQIIPGVRLNVGRKSMGVSVGNRFFRKSVSTSGRSTTTTSIPGTGISRSTTTSAGTRQAAEPQAPVPVERTARRFSIPTLLLIGLGACVLIAVCSSLVR